jgi:phosphoserine phosphatase
MKALANASTDEVERWVTNVMSWKIDMLSAVPLQELVAFVSTVDVTPGAEQLLKTAEACGWKTLCVGAIPEPLIAALMYRFDVASEYAGTRVRVESGKINHVEQVLTPREKMRTVKEWRLRHSLDTNNTVVIGDSIGDLPMMSLVPYQNRIAFNAQSDQIRSFCAHDYCHTMEPLQGVLFNG